MIDFLGDFETIWVVGALTVLADLRLKVVMAGGSDSLIDAGFGETSP